MSRGIPACPKFGQSARHATVIPVWQRAPAMMRSWKRRARMRYGDYVESLHKRKLATGKLATPSSRRGWLDTQHLHLLPAFGDRYLDTIKRLDIEDWKAEQAQSLVTR